MGRSWKSNTTSRENREWPQCHQDRRWEGKRTHTFASKASLPDLHALPPSPSASTPRDSQRFSLLLHFVLHRLSGVPEGQTTRPQPHAHRGGVQERLRGAAAEVQQGAERLLLLSDPADLQRETETRANTHKHSQCTSREEHSYCVMSTRTPTCTHTCTQV